MRVPRWLLGTFAVLGLLATAPAEACSRRPPGSRWEKAFGPKKRLVYERNPDAPRGHQLSLHDGKALKWTVPWGGRPAEVDVELAPNGKLIALWGDGALTLLSAKDGSETQPTIVLTDWLLAVELSGGVLVEARRERYPCGPSRAAPWTMRHEWKAGQIQVVFTTAPGWDGVPGEVRLEFDPAVGVLVPGTVKLTRVKAPEPIDLQVERTRYAGSTDVAERRRALTRLVWASNQHASLQDPQTDPFFLDVAQDLDAPPDFLRLAFAGLNSRGEPRAPAQFSLLGRDAEVDEVLLRGSSSWTSDQQREALTHMLSSEGSIDSKRLAFTLLTPKLQDLGEIAVLASQSTDAELRARLLGKLAQVPAAPTHLSAALTYLDARDPQTLEVARAVVLVNLGKAALKVHTEEILAALTKKKITLWAEGELALGTYLQASGQLGLAGGLFAAGLEHMDAAPSALRNELLSRLALNMMMRSKLAEAKAAIALLKESGGPLGGPLICLLSVPEVRVGVTPVCNRKVPTKAQAEALQRAVEKS